jgi:CRISPR-associated endonuclease/helicase Cas3
MLFSALVDADYLDTERHFSAHKTRTRGEWTRPADLWRIFRLDQVRMMWNSHGSGAVNRIRTQIYRYCVRRASMPPGLFRLTVPTGGGKTRSGLAFALRHAQVHRQRGFRRVIVVLPYTSIIDQTAREYRHIFGDRLVLEHHSQLEISESEEQDEQVVKHRLASENWDHPLIVTTTVQLFESLFHNRPSRCRKLHNIAKSILILDEVQTLPPELLKPTLDVLRDLVDNYGVTVVLSTATQPAFDQTPYLNAFQGLEIEEIVPHPEQFFQHKAMKRVQYQPIRWQQDLDGLADELSSVDARQVLVIFNTRKAALDMVDRLLARGADGVYHLSTLLCGAHRQSILNEIRQRLDPNGPQPVRLVSTQVVEAGVDLDFPRMYRALGPLDRIVQAAGRCNREGRRPEKGAVVIFDYEENKSPTGAYKIGLDDAETLLKRNEPERLHEPELHTEYFQCLFRDVDLDKHNIQTCRFSSDGDIDFPETARRYKLIEDTMLVVVPKYDGGEGERRLQAHLKKPSRETFRRLMPYVVNIRRDELHREEVQQCLEQVRERLYRWTGGYDDKTHRGLLGVVRDPADLIT